MASEVKGAHYGILKILLHYLESFFVRNLSSFPCGLHRFFFSGLQPAGCTQQLTEVEAARPFAWTKRLQAFGLRLRKSCVPHVGYSKRRAHIPKTVASSWSARREGSLGAKSSSSTLT